MNVVAILCSDIHLSLRAPSFRSNEPDWLTAMGRSLCELHGLVKTHKDAVIVCAGDVFDRYNSSPELINWTIANLPWMVAVPGQHDLPSHVFEDVEKSAYWTLVEADALRHLDVPTKFGKVWLYPFPWGTEPKFPKSEKEAGCVHLAVCHRYIWKDRQTSYTGADESKKSSKYAESLRGFDAAVFGDNHLGFSDRVAGCNVFNCGTFFRRKSDERHYRPQVGLLYEDGTIVPHYLDTSKDVYLEEDPLSQKAVLSDAADFIEELKSLGADSLDFREVVSRRLDGIDAEVRKLVLDAIPHGT